MAFRISTGLALVLGLGFALPAAAQPALEDADRDQDGYVTSEEAAAYSEQLFDHIADGAEEITLDQYNAVISGAEIPEDEANTDDSAIAGWEESDLDNSGGLNREEWMQWRETRFDEAAGDEDRVAAGIYASIYANPVESADPGGGPPADGGPNDSPESDAGSAPEGGVDVEEPDDGPDDQTPTNGEPGGN